MRYIKKILKKPYVHIVLLLFSIVSISTVSDSLASDESTDEKQTTKTVKYSTFFNKKTKWCDVLVITCTDFRFTTATQEFINNRLGFKGNYDYISIPGSIRNLLDSKTRDLVLNTVGVSVRLHHVNRVVILGHQDCSIGYGGSKNFSEPIVEYKTICRDLKKARRLMRLRFPHLKVYLYYATVLSKDHQRIYNFKQIL
ncbi:MAG: carbonic anhydrase [Candidatus Brocadia sp.]